MSKPETVGQAEAAIRGLEGKRADLIERKAAMADKRRTVAMTSHAGDGFASLKTSDCGPFPVLELAQGARVLDLVVPPALVARADEVIE
jgi:hypothetical protein